MIDPDLRELLDREREFDDMPEGAEARILDAVTSAVLGPGPSGGGPNGGRGPGDAGAGTAPAAAVTKTAGLLARAAYVAVGVVAGAAGHAAISSHPPSTSEGVAASASASTISAPDDAGAKSAAPAPKPPSSMAAAPEAPSKPTSSAFLPRPSHANASASSPPHNGERTAEERADLDVARAALARGRPEVCLDGLAKHVRTYGEGGAFAEERESLWIQALAAQGNLDEARRRYTRFQTTYPRSLFGAAIERTLSLQP